MGKRFNGKPIAVLASLLLASQVAFPVVNAAAATNNQIINNNMLPPSNLASQNLTPDDVKLTWSAVSGATGYNVYQITDGSLQLVGTTTSASYTLNNLPQGSYSYVVSTLNGDQESGPCAPISVNITYPTMAAPTNLKNTIQNGNDVVLTWTASQYAESYNVYEIAADGTKTAVTTVTGKTTATVSNVSGGTHTYAVSAVNSLYGESPATDGLSVNVTIPTMTAPTNLTSSITNGNSVTLRWGTVSYASGYKVYQIVNGQKQLLNTVTSTSVTLNSQAVGDDVYEVHSYSDRFGESADGSQVTVTVAAPNMTAPSNVASKIQNGNDIVLTWDAVSGAASYKVYQVAADGTKTLKSTVTNPTVTYSNVAEGSYTYEVHSYFNGFGESTDGSQVTTSVVYPTMVPPTNVVQQIKDATSFSLTWDAAPYATSYKVYQIVNGQKVLKSAVSATTTSFSNMTPGDYTYEVHAVSSRFGESANGTTLTFTMSGQTMTAPTNLTYTTANGNDITLKWTAAQYATSYKIYQVIDGQPVLQRTVTSTSATFSNLPAGDYHYIVDSVSSTLGESPTGADLTFSLVYPTMAAPTNLAYKVQNGNDVVLTWTASTYATSYNVYELVNGTETLVKNIASTSATLSNVAAGNHTYVVHAVSSRFGESAEGSQLSMNLAQTTMQAPANLTQSVANGNDITLKWTAAQYATAYKVYQVAADGTKTLKSTVTGTQVTFSNQAAGDYTFEVHSYSTDFGESADGSTVSLTLDAIAMQAPSNLTQSIVNGNDIVLKWTASTYATSYNIYQVSNGQKTLKSTVSGTQVTFANQPAGNYAYEVHAVSSRFGESADGSTVSLNLVFPTMQAPASPSQTIANGNDITLKWTASQYATGYKVYQIVNGQKVLKSTVTGTGVTYTNMPAGDYAYEIHSYSDRFGESPAGSTLTFTLVWPTVAPPTLKDTITNVNNITLSWPSVQWANEYHLYEVNADGTRTLVYKGTALSATINNLSEATHSYEVTAYSTRFGESNASNRVTETIVYPVMQAPTATLKLTGTASATISWGFVTYANNYNIYEVVNGQSVLVAKNVNNLSYALSNLSYANHQYYVTSFSNSFGESAPSNLVIAQLIQDTTAPVTTASAPSDWTNQSATVTLSATDNDTGVAHTYYSVNGGAYQEGTSVTVSDAGVNHVSYYSVDKVGNKEAAKTIDVKIDKTAPVTTASDVPAWTNQAVAIHLTSSDAQSGVAHTYYSVNGSDYVEGTDVKADQDGVNTISFYSVDAAGNKEQPHTIQAKIDRTAPVTSYQEEGTTVAAPSEWSKDDVKIDLTATDDASGVAKTYYSINGADYVEGTSLTVSQEGVNTVSFYSVDAAGNVEQAQTIQVKIDKSAPVTTSDIKDAWTNQDVIVNLSATDAASGVAKTYYSINGADYVEGTTFTVSAAGVNTVSYYTVDAVGNKEAAKTEQVKIDRTAPVTTASDVPSTWTKDAVTVNLSATDDASGVAHTFYSINGGDFAEGKTITVDQAGVNTVTYYTVDVAGNQEAAQTFQVKIDKTAPVTTSDATSTWSNKPVQVNLNATDSESGVAKTYYSINGSDYVEGTSFTVDQAGVNKVSFYTVDAVGNQEAPQTVDVKIDQTAPVTTSDAKATWSGQDVTVHLTATDDASGVAHTYYSVNGGAYAEGSELKVTQAGVNKVSFYTVDVAGNQEAAQTVEVKIDRTAPVTAAANLPTNWTNHDVTVNLSATDAESGVAHTFYSIDGGAVTEGTSFTVSTEGVHTITYYSTDAVGNQEAVQTAQVKIDKTAPTASLDLNSEYALGTQLPLHVVTGDNLSGVASQQLQVTITGPQGTVTVPVKTGDPLQLNQPGSYTVTDTVTDNAGNQTTIVKKFVVYVPVSLTVTPTVIKGNNGVFTVRVDLPDRSEYRGYTLDLDRATLNGVAALKSNNGYYQQAKNGQFKFERSDFNWTGPTQDLEFRGYINGLLVVGHTTVNVQK